MGFLDNSSITVDAILTTRGREILSRGGNFDVTKFALSDEEIDYTMYDSTHPDGNSSFGLMIFICLYFKTVKVKVEKGLKKKYYRCQKRNDRECFWRNDRECFWRNDRKCF